MNIYTVNIWVMREYYAKAKKLAGFYFKLTRLNIICDFIRIEDLQVKKKS